MIELIVYGFGALLFVLIPIVAARAGRRRFVVVAIQLFLASIFLLMGVASRRTVWDSEAFRESANQEFLSEGAELNRKVMLPFMYALLGPIVGLSILSVVPPKRNSRIKDGESTPHN